MVQNGETSCSSCLELKQDCVIKDDDQRRKYVLNSSSNKSRPEIDYSFRPVSKAYVNLLEDRINQLEAALRGKERHGSAEIQNFADEISSGNDFSAGYFEAQTDFDSGKLSLPTFSVPDPVPEPEPEPESVPQHLPEPMPNPIPEALPEPHLPRTNSVSDRHSNSPPDGSIRKPSPVSRRSPTVHKLLSTRGHLSFDQLAGRLRYFGPTRNCHVLSVTQDRKSVV